MPRVKLPSAQARKTLQGIGTAETRALLFLADVEAYGLPKPEREHRFHATRKWRFDFCWPQEMIALESEGGVFVQGRHSRGASMMQDMDKYNAAALLGWKVLRIASRELTTKGVELVRLALRGEAP